MARKITNQKQKTAATKTRTMLLCCILLCFSILHLPAQSIEVKQSDKIKTDNGTPGKANAGDVIQYKVNIQNTGGANATGVQLNAVPDTKTTFVNGSFVSTSIAVNDAYTCTGNVGINVPLANGVLINDFDDNLGGATLTCNTCNPTTNGGTVTLNNDGSFTYIPAAGYTGMDQFTYTINDATIPDGATPIAGDITATVTITISNMIWFIDNSSVAALSDGRSSSPFKTLAFFELVNGTGGLNPAAGHTIYIEHTGTNYSGGVSLENNQIVIGEGHTGTSTMIANENLSVALSFALAPFSLALPNIEGSRPVITNTGGDGITLATNNNLRGLDVNNCSDFGIDDNGNVGTLTINEVSINNTTGGGFRADNGGTLAVTLGSVSSTGGVNGINLNNVGGNFTVSNTTSITNSTSAAVTIANNTSTVNFNALNITNTTSNQTGIFASGGTINSSSGTINTGSGRAVDMDNAALGMMLTAVSCNGCTTGIDLNTTTGSFAVNGTGAANSGGTIQNTTGDGILLTTAQNISLSYISIQNTAQNGIQGTGVVNFVFQNGTISTTGTAAGGQYEETGIAFNRSVTFMENNLSGVVTITGSTISMPRYSGIDITNWAGTISNLNISNNQITSPTLAANSFGSGITVIGFGSASTIGAITKATIDNNVINHFPGGLGIQVQGGNAVSEAAPSGSYGTPNDVTNIINITNNKLNDPMQGATAGVKFGGEGIVALVNGRGQGNFNISNNRIYNSTGSAISHSAFGDAVVTSTMNSNTIVANNTFGSQGIGTGTGISTGFVTNTPNLTISINNNNISQTDGNGILAVVRDNATGILNVAIKNNTVAAPLGGVRPGIRVDAGSATGDNDACLDISGNTSAGSGGSQGIGLRKQGTDPSINAFGIEGMAATATPSVETYVAGLNPAGGGVLLISATSGFSNCNTAPN